MRGKRWMVFVAALVAVVMSAGGASGSHVSVNGSVKAGNPLGAGCGISAECIGMVFLCEPALALKDGVDVSIVDVSAFANRTGTFTFTWQRLNPVIAQVKLEFYTRLCYEFEQPPITLAAPRTVAVPFGAKWMMVTATWATDVVWRMTLNH